jgi:hypothetical protein
MMTSRLSELQGKLAGREDVRLVSISLDPEKDVPDVLRQYADRFKAGPNWLFLTGDKPATYKLAEGGFKLAVADVRNSPEPITHSTKLVLVDRNGWVRGFYDGVGENQTATLLADIDRLRSEAGDRVRNEPPIEEKGSLMQHLAAWLLKSAYGSGLPAYRAHSTACRVPIPAYGGHVLAIGGHMTASDSHIPTTDSQVPAIGSHVSEIGSQVPANGSRVPASGAQVSACGSHVPAYGGHLPASLTHLHAVLCL